MVRLKGLLSRRSAHVRTYFNSTMVRLKEELYANENEDKILFQFHYGSIKSTILYILIDMRENFNSTMVRLKDGNSTNNQPSKCSFQFHYGSIKRGLFTVNQRFWC